MRRIGHLLALFAFATLPIIAQSGFERGDVLVSGRRNIVPVDDIFFIGSIRVHGRDGVLKRELISVNQGHFSEPFYRNGIVYAHRRGPERIQRIDAAGNVLTPFATAVNVNYLSPGPDGGLLAVNGSGEIYQFAVDGTLVRFRDSNAFPLADGGIELATDQCTVFYATSGSLARWNACLDTPAAFFGPNLAGSSRALRVLPDGTFLEAVTGLFPNLTINAIIHVDRDGNLIRSYPIPAWALALDIDGTSFWASAGEYLMRVDIASGEVLSETQTDSIIYGLSVVGEPRAGLAAATSDVPTISPAILVFLVLSLAAVAFVRLRLG